MRLTRRLVPRHWAVPILQGPLKACVGSSNPELTAAGWECTNRLRPIDSHQEIRPGMVVFDVGAHAGFYLLLASLRVQDSHGAFVPSELHEGDNGKYRRSN